MFGQWNRWFPICGRLPNMLPIKADDYNRNIFTTMLQ